AEAAHKAAEAAAEKAQHARDAELEGAMSAASMKAKAEENANRMKDAVKKLCSEVSVLRTIKGKLQLPPTSPLASLEVDAVLDDAEVEKDLEDQLQAMVLSRMLAQERLLDAELDRQQLEDDIEIRGDELARKAMDVGGDMTAQYQEAIRTVDAASSKELNLLKAKVEELSKASQKESRLREREEEVRIELEQLEDRIDKLDEENSRTGVAPSYPLQPSRRWWRRRRRTRRGEGCPRTCFRSSSPTTARPGRRRQRTRSGPAA
ncbi:unnamed protein product, partial [Prorocentrum cordatum]